MTLTGQWILKITKWMDTIVSLKVLSPINPRSLWPLDTKNPWIRMKPVAPFLRNIFFVVDIHGGFFQEKIHPKNPYLPLLHSIKPNKSPWKKNHPFWWVWKPGDLFSIPEGIWKQMFFCVPVCCARSSVPFKSKNWIKMSSIPGLWRL